MTEEVLFMQIAIHTVDDITVVSITGEIDGKTAPERNKNSALAAENNILLDLSGVDYTPARVCAADGVPPSHSSTSAWDWRAFRN